MKTISKIILLLFCLSISTSGIAQTFTKADGGAIDISISPASEVFVIGTSKRIFKYDKYSNSFKLYENANRKAKQIFAYKGNIQGLLEDGRAFKKAPNSKFYIRSTTKRKDIAVDERGRTCYVQTDGSINYGYPRVSLAKTGRNNAKICPINDLHFYVLKNDNSIWEYTNGNGKKLPGAATDIAYDHIQKRLYVVGVSKRIFLWNRSRKNWDLVRNTRNDVVSLAAHNGIIWCTTTRNEVYTTAKIKSNRSNNSGDYKLKITLKEIYAQSTWDSDKKDDYLINFLPTLSLNNKPQPLKYKKYGRIKALIEKHGHPSALYVYRKKGDSDHAAVQIHVKNLQKATISNSGIFMIPKNKPITDSGTDFNLKVVVDEVSKETTRIIQENVKLNLKAIINYLSGKTNSTNRNMGSGYRNMELTVQNNKRIIKDQFIGSTKTVGYGLWATNSTPIIRYTIELVD